MAFTRATETAPFYLGFAAFSAESSRSPSTDERHCLQGPARSTNLSSAMMCAHSKRLHASSMTLPSREESVTVLIFVGDNRRTVEDYAYNSPRVIGALIKVLFSRLVLCKFLFALIQFLLLTNTALVAVCRVTFSPDLWRLQTPTFRRCLFIRALYDWHYLSFHGWLHLNFTYTL